MKRYILAAIGGFALFSSCPALASIQTHDYVFTGTGGAAGLSGTYTFQYDTVADSFSLTALHFELGGTTFDTTNAGAVPEFQLSSIGGSVNGLATVLTGPTNPTDFIFTEGVFSTGITLPNTPINGFIVFNIFGGASGRGDILISTASAAPLPEISTWAMMILGFGAMGFALRRLRKLGHPIQLA